MHNDRPHGHWIVLTALKGLPPFGQSARTIQTHTRPALSRSGTRTRLKELTDMGLVQGWKHDADKYRQYALTPWGWSILLAGVDGITALRLMRHRYQGLEHSRAIELAPIKERWDQRIKNEMHLVVRGVVGG